MHLNLTYMVNVISKFEIFVELTMLKYLKNFKLKKTKQVNRIWKKKGAIMREKWSKKYMFYKSI